MSGPGLERSRLLLFGLVLLVAWVPGLVALAMLLTGHAG